MNIKAVYTIAVSTLLLYSTVAMAHMNFQAMPEPNWQPPLQHKVVSGSQTQEIPSRPAQPIKAQPSSSGGNDTHYRDLTASSGKQTCPNPPIPWQDYPKTREYPGGPIIPDPGFGQTMMNRERMTNEPGYNPFQPPCVPHMDNQSFEEVMCGEWSFFICKSGTYDKCYFSRQSYVGDQAAVAAAAKLFGTGEYATDPKPVHAYRDMIEAYHLHDTWQPPTSGGNAN